MCSSASLVCFARRSRISSIYSLLRLCCNEDLGLRCGERRGKSDGHLDLLPKGLRLRVCLAIQSLRIQSQQSPPKGRVTADLHIFRRKTETASPLHA